MTQILCIINFNDIAAENCIKLTHSRHSFKSTCGFSSRHRRVFPPHDIDQKEDVHVLDFPHPSLVSVFSSLPSKKLKMKVFPTRKPWIRDLQVGLRKSQAALKSSAPLLFHMSVICVTSIQGNSKTN